METLIGVLGGAGLLALYRRAKKKSETTEE